MGADPFMSKCCFVRLKYGNILMSRSPKNSFITHSNYIRAFDYLLVDRNSLASPQFYSELYRRVISSNVLPQNKGKDLDKKQVHKSMHNAWGTEFLLLSSKQFISEDEMIRLSNNWNCIQMYYVLYHCTQALGAAKGQQRPNSHQKTQSAFATLWAKRSYSVHPWSLAYGPDGPINIPEMIRIDDSIHSWSAFTEDQEWSIALKSLRTTREEVYEEKIKEKRQLKRRDKKLKWEAEESARIATGKRARKKPKFRLPLLTQSEKDVINEKLRPFTIMDYLYRLRIKTNYEDANMFTDGPEHKSESESIRECLCRLASATLFLHELMLCRIIGNEEFNRWVKNWTDTNLPKGMKDGLYKRLSYFT